MRHISTFSLIASLSLAPLAAQALNLADTVKLAKSYNFDLKNGEQSVKVADADKNTAYTAFLPSAKAQVSMSKYDYNSDSYRNYLNSDNNSTNSSIVVSQSILNGGADVYNVQKFEYDLLGTKQKYKATLNAVILSAIRNYQDVISKRNKYKLNEENVDVFTEYLNLNTARFEAGEITATDIAQTKSRLAEATSAKDLAMGEMLAAEANFEDVVGIKPPADLEEPNLNVDSFPKTLEIFVQDAIRKNPTLMEARHKSNAAGKSLNIAYSKLLPKVDGEISFNSTDAKSLSNTSGTVYSITARMPIFQSGAEYTFIKKSRHVKDASKYEISRLESLVRANAINAWNNYVISKDVIVNRKASIDSDQKALDGVSEEAKMGTRTTIEVLDSRKNLYQSQLAYQDAISRHLDFCYTIHQLLGDLDAIKLS